MEIEHYLRIEECINRIIRQGYQYSPEIFEQYFRSENEAQISSIFTQLYLIHVKRVHARMTSPATLSSVIHKFHQGKSLLHIAQKNSFAPFQLARHVVSRITGIKLQSVTALVQQPERIEDDRLREQVYVSSIWNRHFLTSTVS